MGVKGFEAFTVLQGELRGSTSNPQRNDTIEKRPGPDLLSENELTSHIYEVGSITNVNGQIKQKLEEIGGTLFFKISRHIHPGGLCTFHDDVATSGRLRQTRFCRYSVAPVPAPS